MKKKTEIWMLRLCAWMLAFVAKRKPELLRQYLNERANVLAFQIFMAMLDREGIRHCHRCPQRFGLKKVGSRFACPNHIPQEEKARAA